MSTTTTTEEQEARAIEAKGWKDGAADLATWAFSRMVNNHVAFGGYKPDGGQYTGKTGIFHGDLKRHFKAATARDIRGLHSTRRCEETGDCLSKWLCVDVDAHDPSVDINATRKAAQGMAIKARRLGFKVLLEDSNGAGGYHLWILFSKPVPTAEVRKLGLGLVCNWKQYGLTSQPEVFPKQASISAGGFGNWVRIPGRHHKRKHWSRFYAVNDGTWQSGAEAVRALLGAELNEPELLTATLVQLRDGEGDKPNGKQAANTSESLFITVPPSDRELARAALGYLNADDYDVWLRVGMCLQSLGQDGLLLWEDWSRSSQKYEAGDCPTKWGTFKREDELKLGTLFHMAEQAGWKRGGHTYTNNGTSNGKHSHNGSQTGNGGPEPESQAQWHELSDEDLGITHAPAIKDRPVLWIQKYVLAQGKLTLIAGDGGSGKSQYCLATAAAITTGGPLPNGETPARSGRVVIVSAEDQPSDTVKPRLRALGADMDRITFLKPQVVIRKVGKTPLVHPQSFGDHRYWKEVFKRLPDTVLLIIDTLPSYLGRGVNDSKNTEVRAILEPFLDNVVEPAGLAVIGIVHLNKGSDARTPAHRILGSVAYTNLARAVYFVARDPDDTARSIFALAKCNLAPHKVCGVAFRIETREVVLDTGEVIETSAPVFEDKPVEVNLNDIVGGKPRTETPDARIQATEWLEQRLEAGPVGSLVCARDGDAFLGRPWKNLSTLAGEERKRFTLGRSKWWREQILKPKLRGCCRRYGGPNGAYFFYAAEDERSPSLEAIAEAKRLEDHPQPAQESAPKHAADEFGEVDL